MFKLEDFSNAEAIMINSENRDFYLKINGQTNPWMHKWECTHALDVSRIDSEKLTTLLKDHDTGKALIMVNLKIGTFYIKIGNEPLNWMHAWETFCSEDISYLPSGKLIPVNNIKEIGEYMRKILT